MNVQSGNSRGRGRPASGDKSRLILDAALRLFAERGFHGTAVPLVAEAAGVATGTIYHYFASKEALVNAVYRDAKARLQRALEAPSDAIEPTPRALFMAVWQRLVTFAAHEPVAFQFLEMQDHVPYLDAESRALERAVLDPLWHALRAFVARRGASLAAEAQMALVWGALVGLVKAERLGYLTLTDEALRHAGQACWAALNYSAAPRRSEQRRPHGASAAAANPSQGSPLTRTRARSRRATMPSRGR